MASSNHPAHLGEPPYARELHARLHDALGYPERKAILIGLDGKTGAGKSTLAAWLSRQFGMPAIHLDLYIVRDTKPLEWRIDDLRRAIEARLHPAGPRPLIVEGILLLNALRLAGYPPSFLVWVELEGNEGALTLAKETDAYLKRERIRERADFVATWRDAH